MCSSDLWGKRQKGITTAVKQLTKEAGNQDDDWLHNTPFGLGEAGDKPDLALQGASYTSPGGTQRTTHEETKMQNKNLVNEAIESIVENDLVSMKENLLVALQEKAQEKLEERKKEIAANYFAQ